MLPPRNPVCFRFERQINDEIAAGQQFDHVKVDALRKMEIFSGAKEKYFGVPRDSPLSMYDVVKQSVEVLPKLRFVYLSVLLEGFVEDYPSWRENCPKDDLKQILSEFRSTWQKETSGKMASTSFLNLAWARYVFEKIPYRILSRNFPGVLGDWHA